MCHGVSDIVTDRRYSFIEFGGLRVRSHPLSRNRQQDPSSQLRMPDTGPSTTINPDLPTYNLRWDQSFVKSQRTSDYDTKD